MKKNDFVQISVGFTTEQADWLRARKNEGYNMTALCRQALEVFIEKYAPIMDDDDFGDPCGGGQGYHDLVELPVEGSPEAEALQAWLKEKEADNDNNDDNNDDSIPF